MTPEAQRIAIAEACGWTEVKCGPFNQCYGTTPFDASVMDEPQIGMSVPNYLSDLNAMHEAEEMLDYRQAMEYVRQLEQKCWHRDGEISDGTLSLVRATAAQRAEAFLRALNLWKP